MTGQHVLLVAVMNPNPYQSPQSSDYKLADIVDRDARAQLAVVVRRFLDEDLTSFGFDELLNDFRDSPDSAVRFVADAVWYHYDDCDDHVVALSKAEWDYFQRLLLLLESDRSVESVSLRRWSWSQLCACSAFLAFIWIAFRVGWSYHLFAAAISFGLLSIAISRWRLTRGNSGPYDPIIFPFGTFGDLASAYDAARFKKKRYPRHIQTRRIRSPFTAAVYQLPFYVMWLILSPVPLAFQMLPRSETQVRVVAK